MPVNVADVGRKLDDLFASPAAQQFMVLGRDFAKLPTPKTPLLGAPPAPPPAPAPAPAKRAKYRYAVQVAGTAEKLSSATASPSSFPAISNRPATMDLFQPAVSPAGPTPLSLHTTSSGSRLDSPHAVPDHVLNMLMALSPLADIAEPLQQPPVADSDAAAVPLPSVPPKDISV